MTVEEAARVHLFGIFGKETVDDEVFAISA
jgi:hypothetical protein